MRYAPIHEQVQLVEQDGNTPAAPSVLTDVQRTALIDALADVILDSDGLEGLLIDAVRCGRTGLEAMGDRQLLAQADAQRIEWETCGIDREAIEALLGDS